MESSENEVIVRFAPSPTGFLHIGSVRTALFNYLFAKSKNGKFILRIEDTDKERSKKEFEKDIISGLDWLGLKPDEVFRQSERGEIYKKYLNKMMSDGLAYISKEEEGDRKEVIRFKNPNKKIKFEDIIRGEIEFDTEELGDFVIARSVDEPLYHLAVVVDDFDMKISHVIRGEDHISNTPRQILLQDAISAPRPVYAHIPLILAPDRSKLSKRHGAVSVNEYESQGYLPEALNNYLALLGWNPGDDREIFSNKELIKSFSLEKVQKGGAIFDIEKLKWIDSQHRKRLPDEVIHNNSASAVAEAFPGNTYEINVSDKMKIIDVINVSGAQYGSISAQVEFIKNTELEDYILKEPKVNAERIVWKDEGKEVAKENLKKIISLLKNIDDFSHDSVKEAVQPFADEKGRGSVMHPMRLALTGKDKSPNPFFVASILGKKESIFRLENAIKKLK